MRPLKTCLLALSVLVSTAASSNQSADKPIPGMVRVRLVTTVGAIVLALDARRAPKTTANFLAYVDDHRFDGAAFYRAARRKSAPGFGFIQGGIGTDARRSLDPIPLERTDRTGIRHLDATISMAHGDRPDSATGNFSIAVGPTPNLDADGAYAGYAAFGHVISGMDIVGRILAQPTGGGSGAMKGQLILRPIRLISAQRLDGVAKPTSRPRPWLIKVAD